MSKKRLRSRLDNLFANLQTDDISQPDADIFQAASTTKVDPKQTALLHQPPSELAPHSGIAIEAGTIRSSKDVWSHAGQRSLREGGLSSISHVDTPAALAVPFHISDRGIALLEMLDDNSNRRWTEDDILFVQEVITQLALALENAQLYSEVRKALSTIENRERYQSNIARAIAALTQSGTRNLQDILQILAQAAQVDRVSYARIVNHASGLFWQITSQWAYNSFRSDPQDSDRPPLLIKHFPHLVQHLQVKGWMAGDAHQLPSAEREWLESDGVQSRLVLAVPGSLELPGILVFDHFQKPHQWEIEEISALMVVANGLANTFSREYLLEQVQTSFEQTQEALKETEQLFQVSSGISKAGNPQDLVTLIATTVLPPGANRIMLLANHSGIENESTEFELIGSYDIHGESPNLGNIFHASSLPIMAALSSEISIYADIHNSNLDTYSKRTLEQLGMQSGFIVPLHTSGHRVGILLVASSTPTNFTSEDARVLQVAGNGIAVALERQHLLQQAQQRALELQTAAEIARDTTNTLALDILLTRIVNLLRERFNYYHVSIFLIDEERAFAVVQESTGEAGKEMKQRGHRLAIGSRSIIGTATATGKPVIVNDITQSPVYFPNPLLPETRAEMGLPLKVGDQILGALDIQSVRTNSFGQDDVAVLQILADQIAIAIDNVRSYELAQKAYEEMREVDRMKSQFLANMSHELRTPLNSIIGFSRVILKGIDGTINDVQKQDLSAIYNSGQHLLALITDILDLSKLEAGKMELQFAEFNLSDLINSAMSTAVGLVKDKPVKLVHLIPDDLPNVNADATRIRQVLINFLSNAAKFTDEGSITVEASLTTNPAKKPEVMVAVTDTGMGIAPEDTAKLFQPFSQVDDSPTRKTGGTGLGLSICKNLIEMHGGRIGLLRSEPGVGSTFFFTLPVPKPDDNPEFTPQSEQGLILLAIDDDPHVISLYERYLTPQGYQVVALTDPKQALQRAIELKPFAITLDVMMPGVDGWQVMHELKNEPKTRDIPIVVCSILEQAEKGYSLGAADYLVKPFLQEDLVNALSRINFDGQIQSILIVDDDPADLRLVSKMLSETAQYHVQTAQGGEMGWRTLQTLRPDAIILDLLMPGLDGFSFLQNLRANPQLSAIPVLILTGADLTPEQHNLLAEFGQQLLTKGLLRDNELLNTLSDTLNRISRNIT